MESYALILVCAALVSLGLCKDVVEGGNGVLINKKHVSMRIDFPQLLFCFLFDYISVVISNKFEFVIVYNTEYKPTVHICPSAFLFDLYLEA